MLRVLIRALLLLAAAQRTATRVINILDAGAVPGSGASTEVAFHNTAVLNASLADLEAFDTLLIPNKTFMVMGGIIGSNLHACTIQIDGTLRFSNDIKQWPQSRTHKGGSTPTTAIQLFNTTQLTITSNGTGTLDGNGAKWWGIPGIGYLLRGKNRPPLLSVENAQDFVLEHLLLLNSPRFNFISRNLSNAVIRHCEVSARRTTQDSHTAVDLTAFNTDGFDVSGRNIHIHDCAVWNQDDTYAVKANGEDTENVLIENVHSSGVGLTIGSIGNHHVRNVTLRNVYMHRPEKGIYIKFRSGATASGSSITNIVYENIFIDRPSSWPIWIGPAQQDIKEASGPYNPCHGTPCSLCWPKIASANCDCPPGTFENITLRNITVHNPEGSPGVIFGNSTNPIKNLVFDGVRVTNPPANGAWGKKYYYCKGVSSGVATGDTWPVPPCFQNQTAVRGH